ncbi:SDR family NAD(P)-dependent oxidoreductase [Candidatus Marimicrobium litorale]|uniref:SDR family NAD(P)-dependent oxidoreductase n=1 Tax=Candidatus Marimicrobium litorale TaxID=2518991 RepID=A0ABT3T327_9GAMM|nr:SDR family NAD(P)-dependent oxidoreductase [Candidatus Marimicrobium litorale]MCX2976660.1 SDR family NAD(P)-dependent oxidoreductase [Candidatus Marimicrobium litorale]
MGLKQNRIAVVTGASRGAGKGIAIALGETGATVYVTGRTRNEGDATLPGTVQVTADAVTAAGGKGVPVLCDHADDEVVRELFERVDEEHGRLDILVNNATSLHDDLVTSGPFWDKPLALTELWNVGMRSHYVASWFAAPLLQANGEGLVVNTSSFGGRIYMHGPAYGAGKAAVDKMSHDMAVDFRPFNVAVVSVWMGLLLTERSLRVFEADPDKYADLMATAETPAFTGRIIDALALDPQRMDKSGQVWIGAELAQEYGITDMSGETPPSHRAFFGPPTTFGDAIVE